MTKEEEDFGKWANKNGWFYMAMDLWELKMGGWSIMSTKDLIAKYHEHNNR
jgi:hypothetical protein